MVGSDRLNGGSPRTPTAAEPTKPTTTTAAAAYASLNGGNAIARKRGNLKTSRSTEERCYTPPREPKREENSSHLAKDSPSSSSSSSGKSPDEGKGKHSGSSKQQQQQPSAPHTPQAKRHPSLLRRSFSFRHWTGGELLRIRALSKEKHHSSSGCIGRGDESAKTPSSSSASSSSSAVVLQNPAFHEDSGHESESTDKSNPEPLDMDDILNQKDPRGGLSRRERAKGKNRTLDNSDLLRLSDRPLGEKEGFLRGTAGGHGGGAGGGQERRLIRFFSGIFSRRDCGLATSTPLSSPSNRGLRKSKRSGLGVSQSSSESVNGSRHEGKCSHLLIHISSCVLYADIAVVD